MARKVKITYVGPGSDVDPRAMLVTQAEADRLIAGGLWAKPTKKVEPKKKEG